MIEVGTDFELKPEFTWAREILEDASMSGNAKVRLLDARFDNAAEA